VEFKWLTQIVDWFFSWLILFSWKAVLNVSIWGHWIQHAQNFTQSPQTRHGRSWALVSSVSSKPLRRATDMSVQWQTYSANMYLLKPFLTTQLSALPMSYVLPVWATPLHDKWSRSRVCEWGMYLAHLMTLHTVRTILVRNLFNYIFKPFLTQVCLRLNLI